MLSKLAQVNIARLRAEKPDFEWKAERLGFGYQYRGVRGADSVLVYACSVIVDDFENCETVWYVDDGKRSETYSYWSIPTAEEALGSGDGGRDG